jgi:hypothetical protein
MGEQRYCSTTLSLGTMEVNGQLHAPAVLGRSMSGLQSQFELHEEKISFSYRESNPDSLVDQSVA